MGPSTILTAVSLLLAAGLCAQAPPPPPGPGPPPTWNATPPNARSSRFEVATVRRSASVSTFGGGMQPGPGRLSITNMSLEAIIQAAYGRDMRLEGVPERARTERYDIAAKAYETPAMGQLMLALRALLVERFGLVAHQETRQVPNFVLKTDGKGPKIKVARGPRNPAAPQLTASSRYLTGRHASMAQLVRTLSPSLGRPVVDQTGLTAEYDFDADWLPEQYPGGVSLFTALKEQVGLRLESSRGRAQALVIDKLNRTPTGN